MKIKQYQLTRSITNYTMIEPIEFTTEHIADTRQKRILFSEISYRLRALRVSIRTIPRWCRRILKPLEWGAGGYWDTTVARKHEYWKKFDLPEATKDIHHGGGFLIEDAMSYEQCRAFREGSRSREGENCRAAQPTPTGQYVNTLINKETFLVSVLSRIIGSSGGPDRTINE